MNKHETDNCQTDRRTEPWGMLNMLRTSTYLVGNIMEVESLCSTEGSSASRGRISMERSLQV
jgi:hypothetical protein